MSYHNTQDTMIPYLREQQALMGRLHRETCIVMVDIDYYKKMIESHGKLASDVVLKTIADYLEHNLRSYDNIYPFGSDRFIICLPATGLAEGFQMIERIRYGLSQLPIQVGSEKIVHATASFGMTVITSDVTVEAALEHAEQALIEAKSMGRNATHVWKMISE